MAQKGDNPLGKYWGRLKKSYEQFRHEEPELGQIQLPAGINGGVARLKKLELFKMENGKNKGEMAFRGVGVVMHPREVPGYGKVYGLPTTIIEPLCDTPGRQNVKTFEQHFQRVVHHLIALGFDAENNDIEDFDDLLNAFKALTSEEVYFNFETWKGKKATSGPYKDQEPQVNHKWLGQCDWTPAEEPDEDDDTGDEDEGEEEPDEDEVPEPEEAPVRKKKAPASAAQPAATKTGKKTGKSSADEFKEAEEEEEPEEEEEESEDEDEPEEGEEGEDYTPEKEDIVLFKPYGTDGKPQKKAVECEVVKVGKTTCDVRSMSDGKLYKGVKFEDVKPSPA